MFSHSKINSDQNSIKKKQISWGKIFLLLFSFILLFGVIFLWRIKIMENKISQDINFGQEKTVSGKNNSSLLKTAKNLVSKEKKALRGSENQRINLLLLGMGGEGHNGKYLTDTIMLVSINPENYQIAFLSIPRDLYVEIPEKSIHTKINAVYAYEIENGRKTNNQPLESLKKIIQNITGQEIHYYLALDFDGFKKIIDDLGGIGLEVEQDIYDPKYPGPNFSYQTFELTKGFHQLDGETALKYARVRHTAGGDFERAKRQQNVLISAKNKAFSLETFLNPAKVITLINNLGEHLRTDITLEEIPSFLELAKNVNVYQANNKVLDAWNSDSLLSSSHVILGGQNAYVLLPRGKNYSAIQALAQNIFDLKFLERQKEALKKEKASIGLIYEDNTSKSLSILNKMGYTEIKTYSEKQFPSINCQEKSFLYYQKKSISKSFSLDNLSRELELNIAPLAEDISLEQDFLICLAKQDQEYFSSQNEKETDEDEFLKEKSIIGENGEILINR